MSRLMPKSRGRRPARSSAGCPSSRRRASLRACPTKSTPCWRSSIAARGSCRDRLLAPDAQQEARLLVAIFARLILDLRQILAVLRYPLVEHTLGDPSQHQERAEVEDRRIERAHDPSQARTGTVRGCLLPITSRQIVPIVATAAIGSSAVG